MTDRNTLLALAERCERATGPDRELDAKITAAVGGSVWVVMEDFCEDPYCGPTGEPYTASFDAALSLMPAGLSWLVSRSVEYGICAETWDGLGIGSECHAPTPVLALCATALRARAAMLPE